MDKVLGIIPARGGSKGLPNKNIRKLGGISLINRTVKTAVTSRVFDTIIVSTDSDEIASEVSDQPFVEILKRPAELATDSALVMDTIRHVIKTCEERGQYFKYMILLQVTAPFRVVADIQQCMSLLQRGADSVISFSETKEPPARVWKIEGSRITNLVNGVNPFLPRQALEPGFFINGLIYGVRVGDIKDNPQTFSLMFGNVVPMITPALRAIDIDTEIDLELAESLIRLKGGFPEAGNWA